MPNYRKKPVIIEARQFSTDATPAEAHAIYQWVEKNTLGSFEPLAVIEGREPWPESGVTIDPRDGRMVIATLEGGHWVTPGDFIIRGVQGEFYPCKSDIFEATYEPAETVPARHETPPALLDALLAMNAAIDQFVAAKAAIESAARDLEAIRVSRLDHMDLDWSKPDHMWLNAFACIRPTDEFAAQVGHGVIMTAMQAHPKRATFTVNAS